MQSATHDIMENMKLYGTDIPLSEDTMPDDIDFAYEAQVIIQHVELMFRNTPMERHTNIILDGMINVFYRAKTNLDRTIDDHHQAIKSLIDEQDGSEVKSTQLETKTTESLILSEQETAFEEMISTMADQYVQVTGRVWKPYNGSTHGSKTYTASIIAASDMIKARRDDKIRKNKVEGTFIAFAGGAAYQDKDAVFTALDKMRNRIPDMVLAHGGQKKGAEHFAALWARNNNVQQVIFEPDFKTHQKAAPFKRNEEIIAQKPHEVIIFPGTGITKNLGQKAASKGIKVRYYDTND